MKYTEHALTQMKKRGVPQYVVEDVLDRGAHAHQRNNREVYFMGRPVNIIVVVQNGDTVVTVVRSASLKRVRRNAELGRTLHF